MRVSVHRSGGFANVAQTFEINSEDLDEDGKDELYAAVDALRDATMSRRHPDAFKYVVQVEGEQFECSESWITETLTRLAGK